MNPFLCSFPWFVGVLFWVYRAVDDRANGYKNYSNFDLCAAVFNATIGLVYVYFGGSKPG